MMNHEAAKEYYRKDRPQSKESNEYCKKKNMFFFWMKSLLKLEKL